MGQLSWNKGVLQKTYAHTSCWRYRDFNRKYYKMSNEQPSVAIEALHIYVHI